MMLPKIFYFQYHDYISGHEANSNGNSEGVLSGNDDTVRLLWTVVTDLTDRSMNVKFFQKDGPVINETYMTHDLVMSEPFTFRLER
jgi:hypothetical protein